METAQQMIDEATDFGSKAQTKDDLVELMEKYHNQMSQAEIIEDIKDQKASMALPRFKRAMVAHLDAEIKRLEAWSKDTFRGGWATSLTEEMNERIEDLKQLYNGLQGD